MAKNKMIERIIENHNDLMEYYKTKNETTATKAQLEAAYEQKRAVDSVIERESIKEAFEQKKLNYSKFINDSKVMFLTEALMYIVKPVVEASENINDPVSLNATKNLLSRYIQEHGAGAVLRSMKYSSPLMSEMALIVEKACDKCKGCEDCCLDSMTKDEFFDDLNSLTDAEDLSDTIKNRVSDAISEFINTNNSNKFDIEMAIDSTKEKIGKTDNPEIKAELEAACHATIDRITTSKAKNLFGVLCENLAASAMRNEELKKAFCTEGSLNLGSVIKSVESMYTVLEALNTMRIDVITPIKADAIIESFKL